MVYSRNITTKQTWGYLRRECNASFQVIAEKCGISKSSTHWVRGHLLVDAKKQILPKRGRPRKISARDMQLLLQRLKRMRTRNVNFTVKQLVKESELTFQLTNKRTFFCCLNENGFFFFSFRHGEKKCYTRKTKSNVSNTLRKWNFCCRVTPTSGKTTSLFIWTEFSLFISEIQLTMQQHSGQEYGVNLPKDSK